MKRLLLIAPECFSFPFSSEKIITDNLSVYDILGELQGKEYENSEVLLIPAEQTIQQCDDSTFSGIELIKHIRLTPELQHVSGLPIVLLHWHSLDYYIQKDRENMFLYSPAIYSYRLPKAELIFDKIVPLRQEDNLTSWMFHSEFYEEISEHLFRNEIAINQFEAESIPGQADLKNKPIWYKKLFYQQGYASFSKDDTVSKSQTKIRLLLVDDLGDKWKPALQKVLPNARIEVSTNISESYIKIDEAKKQLQEKRKSFSEKVSKQCEAISEIGNKKEELKSVTDRLKAEKNKLSTAESNLDKAKNEININNTKLQKLLKELTKNEGVFDALISFKTEDINTETQKGISNLSQYVTNIIKAKDSLAISQQSIKICEQAIETLSRHKSESENELQVLQSTYRTISNEINVLFESLYKSDLDLILLDMHLTKESEGKEYKQMDGYKVLSKLKSEDLNIPVLVFSATKKNLIALVDEFNFLHKTTFLKGITPVSKLIFILNDFEAKAAESYLISILNEVIVFPSYKYREYEGYVTPEYETKEIDSTNKYKIAAQLQLIQSDLKNYSTTKNVSYLTSIVLKLGNILREYRFRVLKNAYDQKNSLFHNYNKDNKISSPIKDLIYWRNKTEHPPQNGNPEKEKYDEWISKLDLKEIEQYLKIVYEGLIFDK